MVVLALAGAALFARGRQQRLDGAEKVNALRACRIRLLETRSQLEHNELAHCVHDLAETDEDLAAMELKLKAGRPVPVQDITKLRAELKQ
jgi:hypothetical protein